MPNVKAFKESRIHLPLSKQSQGKMKPSSSDESLLKEKQSYYLRGIKCYKTTCNTR